jgi:hypothetical protein
LYRKTIYKMITDAIYPIIDIIDSLAFRDLLERNYATRSAVYSA